MNDNYINDQDHKVHQEAVMEHSSVESQKAASNCGTQAYQAAADVPPVYRVPNYPVSDQPVSAVGGKKKKTKSPFAVKMISGLIGCLIGVVLTIGIGALVITIQKATNKETLIRAYVEEFFLNEIDETAMEEGKYKGMVEALGDDYSTYYTCDEMNELRQSTEGVYKGIGVSLSQNMETNVITVVRCYPDTPAEAAGIQSGDILYKIDDASVEDMDLNSAVALIKGSGEEGVVLTMIREGEEEPLEFHVVTSEVEQPMVDSKMLEDQIGYIALYSFTQTTYEQFHKHFDELKAQGMEKVIIDLRDNTGGLLSSVNEILNSILPKGVMVYTVDKYGERTDYYSEGKTPLEMPMVVLINGYTASASEIFAGAVRDYEMAALVGTKTFGKGVVQNTFRLFDGSGLKLTASSYYTPNGISIHGNGLEPDVEVEYEPQKNEDGTYTDNQLEKAVEVIKGID